MSDEASSERFNRELENELRGRTNDTPVVDPEAMGLARRLSSSDFSAESCIRDGLKKRLLGKNRESLGRKHERYPPRRLWLQPIPALAAIFLIAVLAVPMVKMWKKPSIARSPDRDFQAAGPLTAGRPDIALIEGDVERFLRLKLPGHFPAEPAKTPASFIETVQGLEISEKDCRSIVCEMEDGTFILETRTVRIEDIIQSGSL